MAGSRIALEDRKLVAIDTPFVAADAAPAHELPGTYARRVTPKQRADRS